MENVRLLVQEEGRAARNQIAFHVDLSSPNPGKVFKKPPSSPKLSVEARMTKRSSVVTKSGTRVRSASTGRDKKSELQARYWAFLFGNLQRAVDEIYQTCESDESVSECKEVILVLENFTKDFHNLIEWFKLKWDYESTPPPQRPNSLAWEVRKSSSGKFQVPKKVSVDFYSPSKRQLEYYTDAKLSNSCTDTLNIKPNNFVAENEENLYGLCFGDVVFDSNLVLKNKASDHIEDKNPKKEGMSENEIMNNLMVSDSFEDKNPKKEGMAENEIKKNLMVSDNIEDENPKKDEMSENEIINNLMVPENIEDKNPKNEGMSKNEIIKNLVSEDEIIGVDQASQTEPAKSNVFCKLSKVSTMPGNSKKPQAIVISTKTQPKNVVSSVKNLTTLPGSRKGPPLSPTSSVPPRNPINITCIPGRNVAATAFVPGKKISSAQIKVVTNSVKPGVIMQEKPWVQNRKPQEGVKSDGNIVQTENKQSGPVVNKPEINLGKHGEKVIETNETIVKALPTVNVSTNVQCAIDEKISANNKPKVFCDKNIMTDFPALQPPETLRHNMTKPFLVRSKTSIGTNMKKASEVSSIAQNALSTNNTKNVPVANVIKKPEVGSERPPYSAVSKLYRSQTSIEMRPRRTNPTNSRHPNKPSQNQELMPLKGKYADSRGQTVHNIPGGAEAKKNSQFQTKKVLKDEDGWETVKVRSRWRLNPLSQSSGNIKLRNLPAASRYSLPSPATSLPALALHSDDSTDKLHKEKQNQEIAKGLKNVSKTLQKKSSVESNVTKRKTRDEKGFQRSKTVIYDKRQIAREREGMIAKKTFEKKVQKNDLSLKNKVNRELSEAMIDMMDTNVEEQMLNEEELRKSRELYEEEKMLTKEIQDLESTEIEVDTETDETETDGEVTASTEEEDTGSRISALKVKYEEVLAISGVSWADQMDTLEKLEELMAMDVSCKKMAWKDRMSTLEKLEELVARHPGRALELHQKLSSPSRRRTLPDTIQRYHARQASAKRKRDQLLQDKSAKMRELLNKVEEVKAAQAQLIEDRKKRLEDKLKRAEENRASHLRSIQRKAHDEEEKLREIAFINELEAQNKRHDFLALCQEQQDRLQGILDERQRKQEEKAAKEAAVEERRRVLEAERQEKLEKMQERRRKREERIGREQQEKEKERLELAREKARDREERLQALQAAQLANTEELQKKIQQKQEESARRHEENIEHIRQKALETGCMRSAADDMPPRLVPYEIKKLCQVCNVLIESEVYLLSHLRGKAHLEAVKDYSDRNDGIIIDAPADKMDSKLAQYRERQKALRKRCKKIRTRMAQRGEEYLTKQSVIVPKKLDSPNKGRLFKCLKDVDKLHANQGVGQWPNNAVTQLERSLAEINRILEKQNSLDQKVFRDLNGFNSLCNILNLALDIPKNMSPYLPPKCFITTCTVYMLACRGNGDNSRFVLLSNKIALVLDLLLVRLNTLIPENKQCLLDAALPVDLVAGALMKLLALVLTHAVENVTNDVPDLSPRLQDIISYTVSVGVVDKLATYCNSVRDPIDDNPQVAQFLLSAIQLLTTLCQVRCGQSKGDMTQLGATLRATELVGAVSMLYGILLHQGSHQRDVTSTPPHTVLVTKATLKLLRAVALLDLDMFQSVLGAEGMSLQLRHIASYLLWNCTQCDDKELLHQVVEVVGFFAVKHYDNQMMLQSGFMPTVLQQLCNLPFEYFSDPTLTALLFPTLLACCHNNPENRAILEQELSYQLLEDFMKSASAQSNSLIQLIK